MAAGPPLPAAIYQGDDYGGPAALRAGVASRSTRNIQLSKIQDVRVDQGVGQRLFGVGNLAIETAGESSRLTLFNVDKPQELADEIMNRVPKSSGM